MNSILTKLRFAPAAAAVLSVCCLLPSAFGQGSLTPPGAPAPTMKTLAQIEPRTPVDATHTPGDVNNLFVIAKSGSYYLTTNLIGVASKNGIGILASNVCLDLNGFALIGGGASSLSGVEVAGSPANITIRNGLARDWGNYGINTASAGSCVLEHLTATANTGPGLQTGGHGAIANCMVVGNGGTGIFTGNDCALTGCLVVSNHDGIMTGAGCRFRDCTANGNFSGFTTGDNCSLVNCTAMAEQFSGTGITTGNGCNLKDSLAGTNFNGIVTLDGCTITSCSACGNVGSGFLLGKDCTLTGNTARNNQFGIGTGDRCTVVACSASGNTTYGFSVGNHCTVVTCTGSTNATEGISTAGGSTIKDSTFNANGSYGIFGGVGCTVVGCTANANGHGFSLNSESTIRGCTASANNIDGIVVTYSCQVKDNTTASNSRYVINGGAGIHAQNSGNRIEGNVSNSDQYGVKVDGTENIITRNAVRAAGAVNYNLATGNMVGTIVNALVSGAINGGTGGSGLGSTDPWANFSF
jgi:parallel beta-helix repeat protein